MKEPRDGWGCTILAIGLALALVVGSIAKLVGALQ